MRQESAFTPWARAPRRWTQLPATEPPLAETPGNILGDFGVSAGFGIPQRAATYIIGEPGLAAPKHAVTCSGVHPPIAQTRIRTIGWVYRYCAELDPEELDPEKRGAPEPDSDVDIGTGTGAAAAVPTPTTKAPSAAAATRKERIGQDLSIKQN
ncbi:hypothetical protein ACIRRA_45250 [Nocardia sp. NPDC101769]|uniref:hypothetical protein n=1 Tax=Nocardia sp. NPDC101769 TaxID=3364333 RepID=UPI0038102F18